MEFRQLVQHRIVFLAEPVTSETANRLIAQLLLLDTDSHTEPIDLYINSPGGSVSDGIAIVDAIHCIQAPIGTTCIGRAASMAAWVLAAGTPGKRVATPNAEVMIHQVAGGFSGSTSDVQVQTRHMLRLQQRLVEMLAKWTGQSTDRIAADMERDFYMTADEARAYGLVDQVLPPFR